MNPRKKLSVFGKLPFFLLSDTVGTMNFVVTWTWGISHLTPPPPPEIQQMVEDLRFPGEGPPALADVGEEELD